MIAMQCRSANGYVEANEVEEGKLDIFNEKMKEHYNTPDKAFKPYFDHQDIDAKLGHVNLLKDVDQILDHFELIVVLIERGCAIVVADDSQGHCFNADEPR